ncbi:MAG: hypothetical protein K2X90_01700 [Candidatus Babeliaceae bacterium]|nr:hypothetical protein [Candidatus Babeliaceae bacterium]
MIHYSLILGSALLYGSAFIAPAYCWWAVFVFAVPLFYLYLRRLMTVSEAGLWVLTAFMVHFYPTLEGIIPLLEVSLASKVLLIIAFLNIFAIYTLFFFLVHSFFNGFISIIFIYWLFFIWLEHGSFCFLGRLEGYMFCNPLLPLVEYPGFLYYLPKIGSPGLLLMLLVTQASFVYAVLGGTWWRLCFMSCIIFWLLSLLAFNLELKKDTDIQGIAIAPHKIAAHDSITYTAHQLRDYCKIVLKKFPQAQLILFPESACQCPLFLGEKDCVALLADCYIGKSVTLLIGGFRWDQGAYRNTVYWIQDGKVIDIFDKRHAMAVTERRASKYLKKFPDIVPSGAARPVWHIRENVAIVPYICSELFFNHAPDHRAHDSEIIVAFCNDGWVKRDYMRYIMALGARFKAIQWHIPLVYVAYYYQMLCETTGEFTSYQALRVPEDAGKD